MAIDWKLQAAKWRRAFWAAVDDADGAKEILAAKKARIRAKTKKRVAAPKKRKTAQKRKKAAQFDLFNII